MIKIRDFTFRYREGDRPVVSGIDLDIPDGAFVGITGAAGSGKSTLTYALNGIIPHCSPGDFYGSVVVDGLDTCEVALTDVSRLVGSVCQDVDSQFVTSVVEDEILYGLENFGVPRGQIEDRVAQALADMGISEVRDRVISSLSGGQKQKVAIASVLALNPRVLVLDEPTAAMRASMAPPSWWWSRRSRCCPSTPLCWSSSTRGGFASPTPPRRCWNIRTS